MMVPIVVVVALLLLLRAIDMCESAGLTWAHSLASPTGGGSAAIGGGGFAATSFLSGRRLLSGDSGKKDDKGRSAAAKKARPRLKAARDFFHQFVTGHVRRPTPRLLHHLLYWLTAADAVHSVFLNEYSSKAALWWRLFQIAGPSSSPSSGDRHHHNALVPSVYSRLFYFAKLRPRLLYAIGALLRALQLCSPLRRILDPTAGVGAGVNLCALLAGSRWVKPLVLGWATTKWVSSPDPPPGGGVETHVGAGVCVCVCVAALADSAEHRGSRAATP